MTATHAPPWVREACKLWGRQKRRAWAGGDWYYTNIGEKRWHVDGYAESFLGRVKDEKIAAGSTPAIRQHWAEVYWGEALDVQRAVTSMPEMQFRALHLHYVFDPDFGLKARDKAGMLSLTVGAYWALVVIAEVWIWARIQPENSLTAASAGSAKISVLTKGRKRRYKPRQSARVAELSLDALARPLLTLKT